jgi:hypothetical protein
MTEELKDQLRKWEEKLDWARKTGSHDEWRYALRHVEILRECIARREGTGRYDRQLEWNH